MGIPKKNPTTAPTPSSAAQAASKSLLTSRPEVTAGGTEVTTDAAPRTTVRARHSTDQTRGQDKAHADDGAGVEAAPQGSRSHRGHNDL